MDEAISQFISITGSDAEKAKFYVESANGDVQDAVSTFFESETGDKGEGEETVIQSGPRTLSGAPAPPMSENWGSSSSSKGTSASKTSKSGSGGGGGAASSRFASLSDFRPQGHDDEDNDDDDEGPSDGRDPAHFFTGGERSGLSVQNPDHGRRRGGDGGAPNVVQDILQRAKEMAQRRAAGEKVDDDDDEDWGEGGPEVSGKGAKSSTSSFKGQGRTLGKASSSTEIDPTQSSTGSSTIPGGFQLAGEGAKDDGEDEEDGSAVVNRRIIFWQDGFQLEDGPLCRYDDPAHAHTLSMINQGAAPLSFLNVRFGQRVNLTVEQRHEKYTPPPPPPMKPFGGHGNRLGSPAPAALNVASSSSTSNPSTTTTPNASTTFEVDNSKPTTQIQIRLADGQRVVGRFNLTHTVGDVRGYINASHPGMTNRQYVLQESFPPKPISDETKTLEQAGLANAVIIQKWS